jgi:hypothetical protein
LQRSPDLLVFLERLLMRSLWIRWEMVMMMMMLHRLHLRFRLQSAL